MGGCDGLVLGVHLGMYGYFDKEVIDPQEREDKNWNKLYSPNIKKSHASLDYAKWRVPAITNGVDWH